MLAGGLINDAVGYVIGTKHREMQDHVRTEIVALRDELNAATSKLHDEINTRLARLPLVKTWEDRVHCWAERCRQREEEERQQRVMVVTEFDAGDPDATMHAMADEILKYRQALRWLAAAIGWAEAGAPFGLVAPALSGVRGGPARVTSCRGSNEVELSNRKTRP